MTKPADTRSATVTADSASTGSERARAYCREVYSGHGKLEMLPKITVSSLSDLAIAYTPGVGTVVSDIVAVPDSVHELTGLDNTIALTPTARQYSGSVMSDRVPRSRSWKARRACSSCWPESTVSHCAWMPARRPR